MTKPIKFGRHTVKHQSFFINDMEFSSMPLSLAEENALARADAEAGEDEVALVKYLLSALVNILNARKDAEANEVSVDWLLDNLTALDLEGIIEHLRQP